MSDEPEVEEDVLLLELPIDRITDGDTAIYRELRSRHLRKCKTFWRMLDLIFLTEQVRRECLSTQAPRYCRLTLHHWKPNEIAYALRLLNVITKSDGFSEVTGKIFDEIFDHFISQTCVRLTMPELIK